MDIVEVYHAGTDIIQKPEISFSRPDLDFGPGFYLTDIYEQAENWALRRAEKRGMKGVINKYILKRKDLLDYIAPKFKIFDKYDEEWLLFIAQNRKGAEEWKKYTYIEGGVADDRVVDTLDLYLNDFISKETALQQLLYLKPNNQICINSQEALDKFLFFTDFILIN